MKGKEVETGRRGKGRGREKVEEVEAGRKGKGKGREKGKGTG